VKTTKVQDRARVTVKVKMPTGITHTMRFSPSAEKAQEMVDDMYAAYFEKHPDKKPSLAPQPSTSR
jgi:hypothetical protein